MAFEFFLVAELIMQQSETVQDPSMAKLRSFSLVGTKS